MSKKNILIVEDEALVALDIKERLLEMDYDVVDTVSSAEEAINSAQQHRPDLVLMDIMLEGEKDGIQAAEEMRKSFNIPVVFLTAHADEKTLERAKVTQPYGYIIKPFKEIDLRTTIEISLHKHSQERQDGNKSPSSDAMPSFVISDSDIAARSSGQEFTKAVDTLKTIRPFSDLENKIISSIASQCSFQEFSTGKLIAFEGEEEVAGFIVISGRVGMLKSSPNGKELIVELIPPGDPFGLIVTLDKEPYPVSLRAQVPSEIMFIPRSVVMEILEFYPVINNNILSEVFERLRSSQNLARALAHDRVEVRIAAALTALIPRFSPDSSSGKDSDPFVIEMTRQELADLIGSTPETAIRSTKDMERDGLLDLSEQRVIKIIDKEKLADLILE